MSDAIEIVSIEEQPVAMVRLKGAMIDISKLMNNGLEKVWQYLNDKKVEPIGPAFARYLEVGDEVEFVIGFPVKLAIQAEGDVIPGLLPGGEVAALVHIGPYDTLDQSHEVLKTWIKEQGRESAGDPWEIYVTDPQKKEDPSKWETVIHWPLKHLSTK